MASYKNHVARLDDCKPFALMNPERWTLKGHSRAGERTGLWISPLDIMLDAGLLSAMRPRAVFLTHSHMDHSWELTRIISPKGNPNKGQEHLFGTPVYLPAESEPVVCDLVRAYISVNDAKRCDFPDDDAVWKRRRLHPHPLTYGDEPFTVPGVNRVGVTVLRAYHGVQAIGYGFHVVKKKLKSEFAGLGGAQIAELRRGGAEVMHEVWEPQVAFYCDSTVENLTEHDEWKDFPVVVCECTGYPDLCADAATLKRRKHTHIDDLEPIMLRHKDKQWILIHASMCVPDSILKQHEDRLVALGLESIKIWRNDADH
jgi:ribonuclease Z